MSSNSNSIYMCNKKSTKIVYFDVKKENKKKNKNKETVYVKNDSVCIYNNLSIDGDCNLFDTKLDRRAQYIRNKINKKQKKICVSKNMEKINKNLKNTKIINKKALITSVQMDTKEFAAGPYVAQVRKLLPGFPVWMNFVRSDVILPGADLVWFHIEKMISVIHLLKKCDSFTDMICILNLYLGIYFDGSIIEGFIKLFENCTTRLMACQSSGLDIFKSLLNNWQAIKESEAARQLYVFISTVLATGLCKVNNIDIKVKGLEIFRIAATKRVANMVDLVQVVIETTVFFYERGCAYLATDNLWDLLYSDKQLVTFEKEFAFIIANEVYACAGEWSDVGKSSLEYFELMEKVTADILGMIKVSTGAEKSNLTAKLILLEKTKIKVKRSNVAPTMRMKPFSVLLFGGSGIGKSSILPYIIHYLNTVNGFESSRERVATLNPAEKYQSDYRSNTNVVILDDIMNQKLEVSEGVPGDLIIRLINNIPTSALKADVESKGNVMMAPNFVYGTTNVKDLLATQLSNEPVSILRRFDYVLTMTVKDEFKRNDCDMLDSSKVLDGFVPDMWWFTVEKVVPEEVYDGHAAKARYIIERHNDQLMDRVSLQTLLEFLKLRSKLHFIQQREFVSKSADIFRTPICSNCERLGSFCTCTNESIYEYLGAEPSEAFLSHNRSSISEGMTSQSLEDFFKDTFNRDKILEAKKRNSSRSSSDEFDVDEDSHNEDDGINVQDEIKTKSMGFNELFFGKNLPTKTRCEYIRDNTIKKVLSNPFLLEFVTGKYNSIFCWSSICWNFLKSQWSSDKLNCMYFLLLLFINSLVITIVTLPIAIFTKVGLCSAKNIDLCYTWAASRTTDIVLKHTKLTHIRNHKIKQLKKYIKYSFYGSTLLCVIFALRKAFKAYKLYNSQTLSEGGALPIDTNHKIDHWAPVVLSTLPPSLKSSTTSPEQLRSLIEKKIGNCTLTCSETGRKSQMVIFPLCNNIWVVNSHALTGYAQKIDITIREPGTIGPNFSDIINSNNTFQIPDNDLALVVLTSGGSQYDFSEYFPQRKELQKYMCSLIYKDPMSKVTDQRMLCYPKLIKYSGPNGDVSIRGYHYTTQLPTFEGMCMSPIMTYDSKPQILGFHCCGITNTKEGGAAMLCRDEILNGINILKERRGLMVAHSSNPEGLNFSDIGPFKTVKLVGEINKKSPFNYIEKGTFELFGQTDGPRQKASTAVTKTIISDAVAEVFNIPCIWGPPENINNYIPRHKEVIRMCAVSAMDPDRIALATHDYCISIIDNLHPSKLNGIKPLSREITLSGQDGVSQLRSVVMSTSCGFPINKPKNTVLKRTGKSNEFISDIIEAPDYIWERVEKCEKLLLEGKRCHFVFKASLKDEPKKIGSGKVRVFAGVSLEGLLIVRKYFLPLGVVMMRNPYEFESAVGINAHGLEWDRFVKHVTRKGENRMIAGDYAGFDSSMSPTASMAAFSCLLYLAAKCGYNNDDLTVMRGIATEICYPTYDYFGEIVIVAGSEPSGHPMTVFINNIVNSLYIRYAYYSIYSFDKEKFFNHYITQMNYGDDNVMSVSEERCEFNHTAIQRELEKSGVIYTMADKEGASIPFIKMEDCSFLKRSFRYDSKHGVYLAPLEVMSLYKTLHTCVKSDTVSMEMQNRDMLISVLFEAFLQGELFYNDFRNKIEIVLEKCSVVHWFPKGVPSFEFQQEVWDKRYLCEDREGYENPHGSGVVGDSFNFE